MIVYVSGTIQDNEFYYLKKDGKKNSAFVTTDLQQATVFPIKAVEKIKPKSPFVWMPVFLVDDLIEDDYES